MNAPTPPFAALANVYDELKSHFESHAHELMAEVRTYPGPIARCDVQLTKLIEQRSHALERLRAFEALGPLPSPRPRAAWLKRLVDLLDDREDPMELQLRLRLVRALKDARGKAPETPDE